MTIEKIAGFRLTIKDKNHFYKSLEEAKEAAFFLTGTGVKHEDIKIIPAIFENRIIEKGDKVKWIKINRADIITDIKKDIFGDIRYLTKEINGDKIGMAYAQDIELII